MKRDSLDLYDIRPESMTAYLKYYGWHFNKKMCDFAVSHMHKGSAKITPLTKEKVETMFKNHGIVLQNDILYDKVYLANYGMARHFGSAIGDEQKLTKYIKDNLDAEDDYDGMVFNRFYADMCKKGIPIEWEDMI